MATTGTDTLNVASLRTILGPQLTAEQATLIFQQGLESVPKGEQKGSQRRSNGMRTHHYPSDVTDAQWALIEPHIPPVHPGGRPRKTDMRDVVDAVFSILRTGCQWRYLPSDFPPKSTVWRYFDQWRHDGTLDTIHDRLRRKVRTMEKPYHPRTSASVDSQSVDTTSGGQQRGRDNAKNVDGRKRHSVVDSMGLLLAVLVTAGHRPRLT